MRFTINRVPFKKGENLFEKKSFRAFMEIEYKNDRMPEYDSFMLVGIDFDEGLMFLSTWDGTAANYRMSKEGVFPARIEHCRIPKPKPKIK